MRVARVAHQERLCGPQLQRERRCTPLRALCQHDLGRDRRAHVDQRRALGYGELHEDIRGRPRGCRAHPRLVDRESPRRTRRAARDASRPSHRCMRILRLNAGIRRCVDCSPLPTTSLPGAHHGQAHIHRRGTGPTDCRVVLATRGVPHVPHPAAVHQRRRLGAVRGAARVLQHRRREPAGRRSAARHRSGATRTFTSRRTCRAATPPAGAS
jgi:hypothetical protein